MGKHFIASFDVLEYSDEFKRKPDVILDRRRLARLPEEILLPF